MKQKQKKLGDDLISIIIPLYNTDPKILERCLKSIEIQDYKNFEIVIIDDYSTISYNSILKFYAQNMDIIYQKLDHNYGPGVARKIGLQLARGSYLTFMDSDDELYDNTSLMKLMNRFIENPDLDMVSGLANEELEDGTFKKRNRNFIWVFGKLFRKAFFNETGLTFNESRANEDNGFTTMFRMLTDKYEFIDEVVYNWRYEPNSITRKDGHEYYFWSIEGYVYNMIWVYKQCVERGIANGSKQRLHFINVWIRLYFYCIEVLFDRSVEDANKLASWCHSYYESVYKYIESTVDLDEFMKSWKFMVSSSPSTFVDRIINISYPDFYNIIKSNEKLIED